VDVRRVDHDPLRVLLDTDDPVERTLLQPATSMRPLHITRQRFSIE
jgi:hypothetical protein